MLDKWENSKDKAVGKIKETAGKWTDNNQLEFHGKVQGIKAAIGDKTEDMKDKVFDKANDLIDNAKVVVEDKKNKR
ncbi:CsbD family protein [Anaerocolumna sp. AGMB13025]|uniref:CsbD family protein n=1 Tax=Anaerocolumna sp. AGMB13025 TaxID=3039116 RepID=UPI00241C158F|nr:CsbD family protein [Anaerocolumna sp. AGMB13025]WFR54884.1 CsbD family protein [Anaerocolumna sp. AGMB13025]